MLDNLSRAMQEADSYVQEWQKAIWEMCIHPVFLKSSQKNNLRKPDRTAGSEI